MDCRSNEMGYMFYYNLGGTFTVNETGNQSILNNIQDVYWYSRMRPPLGLSISTGALLVPKQGELVCLGGLYERAMSPLSRNPPRSYFSESR